MSSMETVEGGGGTERALRGRGWSEWGQNEAGVEKERETAAAGRVEMPRGREADFRAGRAPVVPGPLFLCWEEVGPLGEDGGRAGLSK